MFAYFIQAHKHIYTYHTHTYTQPKIRTLALHLLGFNNNLKLNEAGAAMATGIKADLAERFSREQRQAMADRLKAAPSGACATRFGTQNDGLM